MTLVAGVSFGAGMPAFIGDLLVSWRIAIDVELPTLHSPGPKAGQGDYFAAGLQQKLVLVRPWFLVAWAGSEKNAHHIISGLDALLPSGSEEFREGEAVAALLSESGDDDEMVALVSYGDKVYPIGVRTRSFEVDDMRVHLLGSGKGEFFSFLQEHPIGLGRDLEESLLARSTALRFGARAMAIQWVTGGGFNESWGGGFEVAYPAEDRIFHKCDRVLFRAWRIDADGEYINSGRSFFARYYGRDLYLSCFNPDAKTFVVDAPIGERGTPPAFERCTPSWTVDMFVHVPTGSFVEVVRTARDDQPVDDYVELAHGRIVGWNMDQAYVDGLVKTALGNVAQGTSFHVLRP